MVAASPAQLAALENIAVQCPAEGGRAVYWAIGLHGQLSGGLLEVQKCGVGERSGHNLEKPEDVYSEKIKLYPNPANGTSTFEYELAKGRTGTLIVSDLLGRRIYSKRLPNDNRKLILPKFPKGIYTVSFIVEGHMVHSQKLTQL